MTSPDQFLNTVKTVSLQVETSFEAFHLITWTLANIDYVENEENSILFSAIDDLCNYWNTNGCAEDELLPALSLAYTFAAHGWMMKDDLALLSARQERCEAMISDPCVDGTDYTSYEELCDKYTELLKRLTTCFPLYTR